MVPLRCGIAPRDPRHTPTCGQPSSPGVVVAPGLVPAHCTPLVGPSGRKEGRCSAPLRKILCVAWTRVVAWSHTTARCARAFSVCVRSGRWPADSFPPGVPFARQRRLPRHGLTDTSVPLQTSVYYDRSFSPIFASANPRTTTHKLVDLSRDGSSCEV